MKVLVLHGSGINSSRSKLLEIKQKFDPNNIVTFDPSASSGQVMAALQTMPMFGEEHLIIVENPPDDLLLNFPLHTSHLPLLILWFDHEIDPKKFKGAEILFFPEAKETSVFPFLDKLAEKNPNAFIDLEKLKKSGLDTQYFITMIFYLLRSLIYQPKNMHPFARQKAQKQSKNFSRDEIISLYKYILDLDFKIKNGLMEPEHGEFLLINRFIAT